MFGFLFSFSLSIEGHYEHILYLGNNTSVTMHNFRKDFIPRESFVHNHRLTHKQYFCLTNELTRVRYKVREVNLDLMQNTTFKFNSELINAVITFILRLSAHKSQFTFTIRINHNCNINQYLAEWWKSCQFKAEANKHYQPINVTELLLQ